MVEFKDIWPLHNIEISILKDCFTILIPLNKTDIFYIFLKIFSTYYIFAADAAGVNAGIFLRLFPVLS